MGLKLLTAKKTCFLSSGRKGTSRVNIVSQKKVGPDEWSYKFCFEGSYYIQIIEMPHIFATTCQKQGFIWWYSLAVMTSNVNSDAKLILQLVVITLCSPSITQQQNYKNGSAYKLTFEVISSKLINKSYSCLLLMIGKQCGNYNLQLWRNSV